LVATRVRNAAVSLLAMFVLFAPVALHHYEQYQLAYALGEIDVQVTSLAVVAQADDPGTAICRLTLRITNPGSLLVMYATSGAIASLGGHEIGVTGGLDGLLGPGESRDLTKDFTLPAAVLEGLSDGEEVTMTGNIGLKVAARWLWVGAQVQKQGVIDQTVIFDSRK
jgi:hypothetical protein